MDCEILRLPDTLRMLHLPLWNPDHARSSATRAKYFELSCYYSVAKFELTKDKFSNFPPLKVQLQKKCSNAQRVNAPTTTVLSTTACILHGLTSVT